MKKIVLFIVYFLFFASNLYAYKNSYFKVNDEGIKGRDLFGASVFLLDLKENFDYNCPDQKHPRPPSITVVVVSNKGNYPSYNQSNAEKLGKEYLNGLSRSSYSKNNDYKLEKTSIDKFGKNQAFYFEISNLSEEIKTYLILSDKYLYTISARSNKGDNFKVTDAYTNFVKSFEILDAMPKSAFKRFFSGLFGGSDKTSGDPRKKYRFLREIFLLTLFIVIVIARKIINSN
ncbi:MAG: hypothetical protein IKO19_02810 [Candidatus Riflebacteria bacterium]|nr:hypothetical protein [Candidatus Riflebacteria bacterium]